VSDIVTARSDFDKSPAKMFEAKQNETQNKEQLRNTDLGLKNSL